MFRDPQSSDKCSRESREGILKDSELCEQEEHVERQSAKHLSPAVSDVAWSEQRGAEVLFQPDHKSPL
jgi:hypothetical protein